MGRVSAPALTVSPRIGLRRERMLPVDGEVLAALDQRVDAAEVVARAELPGELRPLAVAAALGVPPGEIERFLLVEPGARVAAGQKIAETRALFGLLRTGFESPVAGIVESVSRTTGQLLLRASPRPIELPAFLPGKVVELTRGVGVTIEAEASLLQGIFGIGGETIGPLRRIGDRPGLELAATAITADLAGAIVATGGRLTLDALRRMIEVGVSGAIGASVHGDDLHALVGRELNLAATGDERLGLTVVVTEGFGELAMAARAFEVLGGLEGAEVALSGATQVRAGVVRPELIGPAFDLPGFARLAGEGAMVGTLVRIVRGAAFGAVGRIAAVPPVPRELGSGSAALVYEVELDEGGTAVVPRANVEALG